MIRNYSVKLLSLAGVMFALVMCAPIGRNQAPFAPLPSLTESTAPSSEPTTTTLESTPPTDTSAPSSEPTTTTLESTPPADNSEPTSEAPTSAPTSTPPTDTPASTPRPTRANTPPPCPKPQITSFKIDPNEVAKGNSATLNWGGVTNASDIQIDHGIGRVSAPGSQRVSPTGNTTYTFTAFGCSNATAQASIMVFLIGKGDAGIPNGPRSYSRQMQFNWSNRSLFNSDNHSGIEIETMGSGSYQPFEHSDNFELGQNYVNKKNFEPGKYKVRFRWWQVDAQNGKRISLKSEWSVICFNYSSDEQCD